VDIKAQDVKKLREKTGAGMMECKKALVKAEGDFSKAERILKELGLAAAKKRGGRETNEGRIFSKISNSKGIILELSCETDFVARNKDFILLGEKLLNIIDEKNLTKPTEELETCVKYTLARIKENLGLKRFTVVNAEDNELLVEYIHGEGRIGVIVKIKVSDPALKDNDKVKQTSFDLALHVAAFAPMYLSRDSVDNAYIQEQEGLFIKQAEKLGKPEKVIQGIVKGKMSKHFSEVCLLDQGFVKDEKQKVAKVLKDLSNEVGGNVEVVDFIYFRLGSE